MTETPFIHNTNENFLAIIGLDLRLYFYDTS